MRSGFPLCRSVVVTARRHVVRTFRVMTTIELPAPIPSLPASPKAASGVPDQLHHGDCLQLLPQLPSDSVDMVFAALPYGVTRSRWDLTIPLDALWPELK